MVATHSGDFDLVIRGGTVALPKGVEQLDIGIKGETITAIGEGLAPGRRDIDASGGNPPVFNGVFE